MIVHNNQLIMRLREPARVLQAIPASRLAELRGEQVVVLRHSYEHVEALQRLGFKPPALPLQWELTGKFTPMDHQRKTVEFLIANRRAFVLNDMGTGKTGAALWAAEYLMQKVGLKKILIVCPLSVLGVWEEEAFNIMPHRSITLLHGSREKRKELLKSGSDIFVINHDGIETIKKEIADYKFELCIADEAAVYRNGSTKRFKLFKELTKQTPHLWLMTGTPTPTAPTDAWALIKLLNPTAYPAGIGAFRDLTMRRISQFLWVPREEAKSIVSKLMRSAIRFSKEECLDLPPVTHSNRSCELTQEQKLAFIQMKKNMVLTREVGEKITAANAAVKLIKLIQICCGVVRDNEADFHMLDSSSRLNLLLECIEEAGKKAIVFVPFIGVMNKVKTFLEENKLRVGLVNGSVSQTERTKIFSSFQRSGDLDILLAHPKTTSHGLTLTNASTIIWYAPIFSVESYQQANARIHRAGQSKACTIIHLSSTPLEQKLYSGLWGKIRLQDAILEQYEEISQ